MRGGYKGVTHRMLERGGDGLARCGESCHMTAPPLAPSGTGGQFFTADVYAGDITTNSLGGRHKIDDLLFSGQSGCRA
jgi:hypothetical protein